MYGTNSLLSAKIVYIDPGARRNAGKKRWISPRMNEISLKRRI
jgi:hypothetical protein